MALIIRTEMSGPLVNEKYTDSDLCKVSVKADNDNKLEPRVGTFPHKMSREKLDFGGLINQIRVLGAR